MSGEPDRGQPHKRPTIDDIAADLGLSKSTVSRAFNRPNDLSLTTVHRVLDHAKAINYQPNRAAQSLSTGRKDAIGLIVPDIVNPFFPRLIRAVQHAAKTTGRYCVLLDSEDDPAREQSIIEEFRNDVNGFILLSPRLPDDALHKLSEESLLVAVNRSIESVPHVLMDAETSIREGTELLYTLGHRQFAYVAGPEFSWTNRQRREALRRFASKHRDVILTEATAQPATFEGGADAACALIPHTPTAFICFDDVVALGVMSALRDLGYRIPEEVSIIGCDNTLAPTSIPRLTTIEPDYEATGTSAVSLLSESRDAFHSHEAEKVVHQSRLIRGASISRLFPLPTSG